LVLARREQLVALDRDQLCAIAAGAPVVRHAQPVVRVAGAARHLQRQEVACSPAATRGEQARRHGGKECASPHTKISRAPAVSRRKRGVEMTPASRSSTWSEVNAIVSTEAAHAYTSRLSSSSAVSRSSPSERPKVSRPPQERDGEASGSWARRARSGSRSSSSAPKVTSAAARSPSAAADTSTDRPE